MVKGSGRDFDPILLKVFINMLGVYPVGTLLKLDTGELGLVVDCESSDDLTRPKVVLLERDGSEKFKKGACVRLSARHTDSGSYKRNIVQTCHASDLGLQPSEFIM